MRKASRKTLERLSAAGVRFARSCVVEADAPESEQKAARSRPQDKGYLDAEGLSVDAMMEAYAEGRWCKAVLRGSELAVVDVDLPEDEQAVEIMKALDEAGVAKAKSGKGYHYYLRRDANSDSLLGRKARYSIRANNNRKGSAISVELLADHSTAYEMDEGQFVDFGKVRGLYPLLAFKEAPAPLERAEGIYRSLETRLRSFKAKDGANSAACALLYQMAVRFKQGGLMDQYQLFFDRLTEVYYNLRPQNKGVFDGRADEFATKVGSIPEVGESDASDFCNALVETYLVNHDHHVFISAEHGKDNERTVVEWEPMEKRYVKRGFGEESDGKPHVRGLLKDMFCQSYEDRFGVRPAGKMQNTVIDDAVKLMKSDGRFTFTRNPLSMFDREQNGVSMIQSEDWSGNEVYRIDPSRESGKRLERTENKPEYRLYASFGEVSDKPSEMWERFLKDVLIHDDMVRFLGMIIGSAFVPHSKNPLFVICNGGGRNGKSVLLKTLNAALGDYACNTTPVAFTDGSGTDHKRQLDARSMMVGKRIATCTESSSAPLDLTFIKSLTDGEAVEVGGMFKTSEHVELRCLPLIATNVMPILFEVSVAVRSRIKVIPFNRQFLPNTDFPPDLDLEHKLRGELAGVRRWVVDYAMAFMDGGRRITVPKLAEQTGSDYMEANRNQLDSLLEEWLEVTSDGIRPMKQGRKHGKEYDGLMAVLAKRYEGTPRSFREKKVKALLTSHGITRDGKGRLNCKPTEALLSYLDGFPNGVAEDLYRGMWAKEPLGMDPPEYKWGKTNGPNLREIPAEQDELNDMDTGMPAVDGLGSEWK